MNSLTLTVLDQDTALAIEGAAVALKESVGDTEIDSDLTDAVGGVTLTGLTHSTGMYLEISADGYDSVLKAGQYEDKRIALEYGVDEDDITMTVTLPVQRARTSVVVMDGSDPDNPSPIEGAAVTIVDDTDAEIETGLTTDANGCALLDDSLYGAVAGGIKANVTADDYVNAQVSLSGVSAGTVVPVLMQPEAGVTTYTLTGRLLNADGTPKAAHNVKLKVLSALNITGSAGEYYVMGQTITATTNAAGVFVFTLVEGLVVQPVSWAQSFGYPDKVSWTMTANRELGDGSAGTL